MQAVEVAATGGDRIGHAPGINVEEGLLLNGVGVGGYGAPIHERDQGSVPILTDAADPGPAVPDEASVGAGDAPNGAVRLGKAEHGEPGCVAGERLDRRER
jgi:hypothetical protein